MEIPVQDVEKGDEGLMPDYYIYFLRRPDKEDPLWPGEYQPFYVGKGSNGRHLVHRDEAKSLLHKPGRKPIKINIIHSLWKSGFDFFEEIILDNLTELEAFEIEKQTIMTYGRIDLGTGCLANMTDGGDGKSGWLPLEDTRRRLSEANKGQIPWMKGKVHSEETKQKIRKNHKGMNGKIQSIETRLRISEALKGKTKSEETKKKMSAVQKKRPYSEEWRRKNSEGHKGIYPSEETRIKMSNAQKQRQFNKRRNDVVRLHEVQARSCLW